MTDYYPHHSTYDHQQQTHSGHSISYADPTEENAVGLPTTHGSHQSHTPSHASVSASTRSWVYSNQMNPPPAPVEVPAFAGQTPFHGPRPLPDPHLHQQQHYANPIGRPFQYDAVEEEEEDGDDMPSDGHILGGFHFEHPREPGGFIPAGPSELTSPPSSPRPIHQLPRRNRSFVGGFFRGLKRIPRMFGGGDGKGRLVRRGTFGTEGTGTTALTGGNTLPRYLSNPSIGPTNPQFAHRLSQAVASGTLPPDVTPSAFQIRPPLVSPQQPVVTVTPPSDGAEEEQQAEYFEGPPMSEPPHDTMEVPEHYTVVNPMERTTVMMYGRESQVPTVTLTQPLPNAPISTHHSSSSVPRVSYPADLPTRSNSARIQREGFPLNPGAPMGGPSTTPLASPPRERHRRTTPQSFSQAPKSMLSSPTSGYTVTTATSYYDPSFASNLGPVEKFFKGLYNLPWISQGRVTVDYRPGDSPRAKGKIKSLKKPLSSWYHSVLSRSRRNSLDLLSSNTSGRTSNIFSSLASPISRRTGRSSNHRHRSPKSRHHRSRRRHTTSTSTTGADAMTHRSASPIIPSVYPYTIPPYPPYTFPYVPYPAVATPGMNMPTPVTPYPPSPTSARSPRGPRAARSHRRKGSSTRVRYPHGGYAPFQPLAMPPPPQQLPHLPTVTGMAAPGTTGGVYFVTPSPPQSQDGDAAAGQTAAAAAPVQFSPVFVQYIPAAYRPVDNVASANVPVLVSPPTTPQKPSAVASGGHHS